MDLGLSDPQMLLAAWDLPVHTLRELRGGLINQTWRLESADARPLGVLQRLNTRIFAPEVHEDIEAVTAHLEARGLPTPRLIRTREGGLWHELAPDQVWRVLSWVGDRTVERLEDPSDAREAGALLGRFHAAVADLDWRFRSVRSGAHDTEAHMARMGRAVQEGREHRLYEQVAPLAEAIAAAWESWEGRIPPDDRIIHGDAKIANVRFAGARALCLVDLDTMARGSLQVELGDALRSWVNTAGEDRFDASVDLELLGATLQGYARGCRAFPPSEEEWDDLLPGLERICLELASRFAWDALEESYFGWDARFGGHGEHSLLRARGQLGLARSARQLRPECERLLDQARRK